MPDQSVSGGLPEEHEPKQGLFDEQLAIPALAPPPELIDHIVKRDGRREPFSKRKVAEAILKAARVTGSEDWHRAQDLASAVALYLARRLGDAPPTVDQVHDAVERVLVEMGHERTALVYVSYRDKRLRLRRLLTEDRAEVLGALDDARRERMRRSETAPPLFVRSGATVTDWDRDRIREVLVQETGLDAARSETIAEQVERQVIAGNVDTLTTALIRELVNAKLIEHGLESYTLQHMRLGVPVYDADRIICTPYDAATGRTHNPDTTNQLLAERVKREYALTHVFTADVTNAHLLGDIHLHDLEYPDRLYAIALTPERIKRYGIAAANGRRIARPATTLDQLLSHVAAYTGALTHYFTGPITWEAFNIACAPYLAAVKAMDEDALVGAVESHFREFYYRGIGARAASAPVYFELWWETPPALSGQEAIGPGGNMLEHPYPEFATAAQRFAWAALEAYKRIGAGSGQNNPTPIVCLTPAFFTTPNHQAFLKHVAEVLCTTGRLVLHFRRDEPFLPHTTDLLAPGLVVAHRVTLNLPRLAYVQPEGGFDASRIRAIVDKTVAAHVQKQRFIQRLFDHGRAGPFALLCHRQACTPLVDIVRLEYGLGVTGLAEYVRHRLGGKRPWLAGKENVVAEILHLLRDTCREWTETEALRLSLFADGATATARRFAELDLETIGAPARRLVTKAGDLDVTYTRGVHLPDDLDASPLSRLHLDSGLHECLAPHGETVLPAPDADTPPDAVMQLITKAASQTACNRIRFVRN